MLVVGAILLIVSIVCVNRMIGFLQVTGYEQIDTLIFGFLSAVGLIGLCCMVSSLVLEGEDSEDKIDDDRW